MAGQFKGERLGAVVVGGRPEHTDGGADKTFAKIQGAPLIAHTLRRLAASDAVERIVLVVAADSVGDGEAVVREYGIGKIAAVLRRRRPSARLGVCRPGGPGPLPVGRRSRWSPSLRC